MKEALWGYEMQQVQFTFPVGTVVQGRYVIEKLLGKGGFGAVYLVRDRHVKHNRFALKELIDSSKQERERFAHECELLRRLDYQALPRVHAVFDDNKRGRAYMLMDYIEGPNLEILRRQQPEKRFSLPLVLHMMAPIIAAVSYLHNQQPSIIHRDIKPANIVVPAARDKGVLVDFGIAKEHTSDTTTTAIRRASPGYAAPEQYSLGTDVRTDVYGLAATCYVLLTGVVPADSFFRLTQLASRGIDPLEPLNEILPTIPLSVAEVIHRALSIRIDERFSTVEEFWQAMNADLTWQELPIPDTSLSDLSQQPATLVQTLNSVDTMPLQKSPTRSRKRGTLLNAFIAQAASSVDTMPLQKQAPRSKKLGVLLSSLLVLFIALGAGVSFWSSTMSNTSARSGISTPTFQPTATTEITPTPVPTSIGTIPNVAGSYTGSIYNTAEDVNSTLSLSYIGQNGENINGNLMLGSELIGGGPFTGSVDAAGHIQFTVPGLGDNGPLHFEGMVQADGRLNGSYCSLDRTNQCNQSTGGFGTWEASPI